MLGDGAAGGAAGGERLIGDEHEALEALHIGKGRGLRFRFHRPIQGDVGQLRAVPHLCPGGPAVVNEADHEIGLGDVRNFHIHGDTGQGGEIHARGTGQGQGGPAAAHRFGGVDGQGAAVGGRVLHHRPGHVGAALMGDALDARAVVQNGVGAVVGRVGGGDIGVDVGIEADAVVQVIGADFIGVALIIPELDVPAVRCHVLGDGAAGGAAGGERLVGDEHEALEARHAVEGRLLRLGLHRPVQGDVGQLCAVPDFGPGAPALVD